MKYFIILFCLLVAPFVAVANEAKNIAPQHHLGNQYLYQVKLDMDIDQNIETPEKVQIQYRIHIASNAEIAVNQVNEDNSAELQVKLIKPQMQFSVKNLSSDNDLFNISFDSTKEDDQTVPFLQFIYPITNCLDGIQFTVMVDSNGHITDLKDLDAARQKVEKELAVAVPENIRQQICAAIESELLTKNFTFYTHYLPDHPVKIGDQWMGKKTEIGLGDDAPWTMSEADGNKYKIARTYTSNGEQLGQFIDINIFEKMKMDVSETLNIDKTSHLLLSNQTSVKFDAHQKMPLPDGREFDGEYAMSIHFSLIKQ